jgi:putative transposase
VFEQLWALGLQEYDALQEIQWAYQAMDGALTKAPLGGEKTGPNPTDRGKRGTKRSILVDGRGVVLGVAVMGANTVDFQMLQDTLDSIPAACPLAPAEAEQGLWLDTGALGEEGRQLYGHGPLACAFIAFHQAGLAG